MPTPRKRPEDLLKEGRKPLYKPEYTQQAYKLTLLGFDDKRLATFFGVSLATVSNWKISQPEFLEALKEGKENADANVSASLYHRACGYSHPEVDIKVIDGQIVKTELIKHYPPDTGAAMAWLKNRQRTLWRDQQNIDHTSEDGSMSPPKPEYKIVKE